MENVKTTRRQRNLHINRIEFAKPFVFYTIIIAALNTAVLLNSTPSLAEAAGLDAIEDWDRQQMQELDLAPQCLSPTLFSDRQPVHYWKANRRPGLIGSFDPGLPNLHTNV